MATFIPNVTDIIPDQKLYKPDFGFIDKMMQRKSAQYEQGFAQLNNQYNLINREVTNQANAKVRDEFLQTAKTNLKDLSAMDLSDSTNVKNATNVFKPFYTNNLVLGDQAITTHWNKQEAIAESFRLKDGGKEFSQDNLNYIKQQRQSFANDDPGNVGQYLSEKRSYNPYYNYSDEVKEAMKNFKPSHTKIETINGLYTKTIEDQSWNKLEISKYLQSVLSDKAKQQMKIESSVRLAGDINSLSSIYLSTAGSEVPKLTELIDKYDVKIKLEKDPEKLAALREDKKYYDDKRAEITSNVKSIKGGDVSFLKKNSEALAFNAYYDGIVDKYSKGFSHADISQEIGADEVGMMYARQAFDWKMHKDTQAFDLQKIAIQHEANKALEKYKLDGLSEPVATGPRDIRQIDNTPAGLDAQLAEQSVVRNNKHYDFLSKVAREAGIPLADFRGNLAEEKVKQYIAKHPKDQSYSDFLDAVESEKLIKLRKTNLETQTVRSIVNVIGTANYAKYEKFSKLYKSNGNNIDAAARAIGETSESMRGIVSMVDAQRQNYLKEENLKQAKGQPGWTFNKESPKYKNALGYLSQGIDSDDVGGIFFFPPQGTETSNAIDVRLKEGSSLLKTLEALSSSDIPKEMEKYKVYFNLAEAPVWNPTTKSIMLKNAPATISSNMDIYAGLKPVERDIAQALNESTTATSLPLPNMFDAGPTGNGQNGKRRIVEIEKVKKSDRLVYQIRIDGLVKEHEYETSEFAIKTAINFISSTPTGSIDNSK